MKVADADQQLPGVAETLLVVIVNKTDLSPAVLCSRLAPIKGLMTFVNVIYLMLGSDIVTGKLSRCSIMVPAVSGTDAATVSLSSALSIRPIWSRSQDTPAPPMAMLPSNAY